MIHTLRMEADHPGIYRRASAPSSAASATPAMRMDAVGLNTGRLRDVGRQPAGARYQADRRRHAAAAGEDTFLAQCSRCHQVNGLMNENADGTDPTSRCSPIPDQYVVAGAAPNLTNLMTRTTFAGATFDLLTDDVPRQAARRQPRGVRRAVPAGRHARTASTRPNLRDWIRNAPAKKPMYRSEADKDENGGKYRGMPNLNLTETRSTRSSPTCSQRK